MEGLRLCFWPNLRECDIWRLMVAVRAVDHSNARRESSRVWNGWGMELHVLEREELGLLGEVRMNPSSFCIQAVFPRKAGIFSSELRFA